MAGQRIAILGGGRIGEALVAGLKSSGWGDLVVTSRREERVAELRERHGVDATTTNADAVRGAALVVVAVKPQDIDDVLAAMAANITPDHLVISIAAGIPISLIQRHLGPGVPIVRAMPNTPALLREGAAAIAAGTHATPEHMARADEILSATCRIVHLPEKYLDAVTGVSGTGPAYVFFLAEALIEAAVGVGLPRDVATELSVQTLLGAARMLRETGKHPVELREEVTSPGGTTVAAMRVLERAGVRSAFLDAVRAATERSRELAEGHA